MARWPWMALMMAALLAAAAPLCLAGSKRYDLTLAEPGGLPLQITGTQTLTCKSQWHKITVKSAVAGALSLTADELRALLPKAAAVKETWEVPEAVARGLAERLFDAMQFTHDDAAKYDRWRGSQPANHQVSTQGTMKAELAAVEDGEKGEVARVLLTGSFEREESGHMGNRYGPNAWKAQWKLPLTGSVEIDLAARKVVRFVISSKGTVAGGYGPTDEEGFTDPWRKDLHVEVRTGPLAAGVEQRLERLIAELGAEEFARREQATKEAAKLEPGVLAALVARLEASDDPELRYRATLLRPAPKEKESEQHPDATGDIAVPVDAIEWQRW